MRPNAESTLRILLNSFSCCSHIHFVFSSFFSLFFRSLFSESHVHSAAQVDSEESNTWYDCVCYTCIGIASINRIECLRAKQREAGNEQNVEKTTLHSQFAMLLCSFLRFTQRQIDIMIISSTSAFMATVHTRSTFTASQINQSKWTFTRAVLTSSTLSMTARSGIFRARVHSTSGN